MADITPNKRALVLTAQKKLRKGIQELKDADQLTAAQRDQLFARVLIGHSRILLNLLGKLDEVE